VPRFGYSVHPVIYGDTCIIAPSGKSVGLAALDKKTGKTLWRTKTIGGSHSSPILVKLLDREMLVMPGSSRGTLMLTGFDPMDGKQLFRYTEPLSARMHNSIPNISVINTDTAFLSGGYGQGSQVLKFTENDGSISVKKSNTLTAGTKLHPALIIGDKVFMTVGSGRGGRGRFGRRGGRERGGPRGRPQGRPSGRPGEEPAGRPGGAPGGRPQGRPGGAPQAGTASGSGLVCMDSSGKVIWSTGSKPGLGEGSIINAGSIIISQDGGDGTLRLIEPGPAYKELASAKVFSKSPGREIWAPMALSNGKLVMRSQAQMVCVDLSPPKE